MPDYTKEELTEALRAVNSIIHKCEKAQEKFAEGDRHHTLLRNRLKAMYISKALITERLSGMQQTSTVHALLEENSDPLLLLSSLERLHTTDLGTQRIKKNLRLCTDDVVDWCRGKIQSPKASITRKGKNWYIVVDGCEITVNAHSYTIITAHKKA